MSARREGVAGWAEHVPLLDPADPRGAMTVIQWLIRAPGYHPVWTYYLAFVVRLDEHPKFPPPRLHFEGATHEFLVTALHPDHEPYDVTKMQGYEVTGDLPWLSPPSVCVQFEATDAEMLELCELAVRAVVDGRMNPEPPGLTEPHWDRWKTALVKTLAHIRREEHAP